MLCTSYCLLSSNPSYIVSSLFHFFFPQTLEEEFAREEREQQLFYARNSSEFALSSETTGKESEAELGDNLVDGYKTPEDNVSSKSSSGSTDP